MLEKNIFSHHVILTHDRLKLYKLLLVDGVRFPITASEYYAKDSVFLIICCVLAFVLLLQKG